MSTATGHSSSSPSPFVGTGTQLSDTPTEDNDEYERLMRSSPPPPDLDDTPSDSTTYNNQGQRWDDIIDPALDAAADSTPTSTAIARPGGVRNESAAARRLAEREKLLPYQRTSLEEFMQVWFLRYFWNAVFNLNFA